MVQITKICPACKRRLGLENFVNRALTGVAYKDACRACFPVVAAEAFRHKQRPVNRERDDCNRNRRPRRKRHHR